MSLFHIMNLDILYSHTLNLHNRVHSLQKLLVGISIKYWNGEQKRRLKRFNVRININTDGLSSAGVFIRDSIWETSNIPTASPRPGTALNWWTTRTYGGFYTLYRRKIFIDKYLPRVKYVHLVRHSLFVMRNDSGCEEFLLNKTAAIPETCSLVMEGCLMVNSPTRTSYCNLKI